MAISIVISNPHLIQVSPTNNLLDDFGKDFF